MIEGAKYPRRITIHWGPLTDGYAIHRGLLFEGKYAMHIDRKFSEIRLDHVVPFEGHTDVYTNDHDRGHGIVISMNAAGGEQKLKRIYVALTGMTAFELVTRVLLPQYVDFEIFPHETPDESCCGVGRNRSANERATVAEFRFEGDAQSPHHIHFTYIYRKGPRAMKRYTIFQIYAGDEDFLRDQEVREDEHRKFIVVDGVKSYVELSAVESTK